MVYISFFRSFSLRLSSVVVAADSERSKSHNVFELGVQCVSSYNSAMLSLVSAIQWRYASTFRRF